LRAAQEGVAILLRDGVWTRDKRFPVTKIAKGPRTGWKNGIALHARRVVAAAADDAADVEPSLTVCFVSVHLRWGNLDSQLGLLAAALAAPGVPRGAGEREGVDGPPLVLGGDFNVEAFRLAPLEPFLAGRGLRRLAAPHKDTALGAYPWLSSAAGDGDGGHETEGRPGKHAIDHLYVSADLALVEEVEGEAATPPACTSVGALPPRPLGPWSAAANDGSDHAWAVAALVFKAPTNSEASFASLGQFHGSTTTKKEELYKKK
jgi:endonuclease/exonuclease/phosphatase family metal-dependent hydrolase